jgi:hypothetical protein
VRIKKKKNLFMKTIIQLIIIFLIFYNSFETCLYNSPKNSINVIKNTTGFIIKLTLFDDFTKPSCILIPELQISTCITNNRQLKSNNITFYPDYSLWNYSTPVSIFQINDFNLTIFEEKKKMYSISFEAISYSQYSDIYNFIIYFPFNFNLSIYYVVDGFGFKFDLKNLTIEVSKICKPSYYIFMVNLDNALYFAPEIINFTIFLIPNFFNLIFIFFFCCFFKNKYFKSRIIIYPSYNFFWNLINIFYILLFFFMLFQLTVLQIYITVIFSCCFEVFLINITYQYIRYYCIKIIYSVSEKNYEFLNKYYLIYFIRILTSRWMVIPFICFFSSFMIIVFVIFIIVYNIISYFVDWQIIMNIEVYICIIMVFSCFIFLLIINFIVLFVEFLISSRKKIINFCCKDCLNPIKLFSIFIDFFGVDDPYKFRSETFCLLFFCFFFILWSCGYLVQYYYSKTIELVLSLRFVLMFICSFFLNFFFWLISGGLIIINFVLSKIFSILSKKKIEERFSLDNELQNGLFYEKLLNYSKKEFSKENLYVYKELMNLKNLNEIKKNDIKNLIKKYLNSGLVV